ncbi:GspJ family T2SS minor pseudopilin variant XcpW [Silvimonas sp. JCM 19000]
MSRASAPEPQRGFTLLEILIALSIFAVVILIAYRGLSTMIDAKLRLDAETTRWREMSLVMSRFGDDLTQSVNRSYRDSAGNVQPPLSGNQQPNAPEWPKLDLVRAGGDGGPFHVAYRLREGRLEMELWDALDQPPRAQPVVHVMLQNVERFEVTFMDSTLNWQTTWPITGSADILPRAVRIVLQQTGQGAIERTYALP